MDSLIRGKLEPFTLAPVLVEKPWGGRRLERFGKDLPGDVMIGESWEVADLPDQVAPMVRDPRSRVAAGPLAGMSLRSVIEAAGEELLGPVPPTSEGRFPLLVKLLDAREHLSIQVHPHEGYVATHPGARLKTESWYVLDSEPGSLLFHGIRKGCTLDEVTAAIGTSALISTLRTCEATAGSFHHVPAGLVHSLGAGVMVAEIQTPSDTTFRLYDWAEEYDRAPRAMHFQQGAESIVLDPHDAITRDPWLGTGIRELTENEHYWIREHRETGGALNLSARPGPRVLMVISGALALGDLALIRGGTAIVPASAIDTTHGEVREAVFLEIGLTV